MRVTPGSRVRNARIAQQRTLIGEADQTTRLAAI